MFCLVLHPPTLSFLTLPFMEHPLNPSKHMHTLQHAPSHEMLLIAPKGERWGGCSTDWLWLTVWCVCVASNTHLYLQAKQRITAQCNTLKPLHASRKFLINQNAACFFPSSSWTGKTQARTQTGGLHMVISDERGKHRSHSAVSEITPTTTIPTHTHTLTQCLLLPFLPSFYSTAPLMSLLTWHQRFFPLLIHVEEWWTSCPSN